MNIQDKLRHSVEILVDADLTILHQLDELLEREREAISGLQFTEVDKLVTTKTPLIKQLQDYEVQRSELVSLAECDSWASVVRKIASQAPSERFEEYNQLRATVARRNQTNQLLAATTQQRVSTLYALLNGQPADSITYDKHGRTHRAPSS